MERTARHIRKEARAKRINQMSGTEDERLEDEHFEDERFEHEQPPSPPPPPPHPPVRKPMKAFANPNVANINMGIQAPEISANTYEINSGIIQLVEQNQFGGEPTEDPYGHIRSFEKVCNTFKTNGVSEDAIKLRLFPFSLRNRAASWEQNLTMAIRTWDALVVAFIHKFFPPGRTAQLMAEITHFAQWDQESLYEAWERYKDMLRKCPHHGLNEWMVIQTFFSGLHPQYKNDISAAAGGALMNKTYEEAIELIENLSEHSYAMPRSSIRKIVSVQESNELKAVKTQLATITNQLKGTTGQPPQQFYSSIPELYPSHSESQSPDQVQYVQNRNKHPQNDPFSNTYNEGWNKNPNMTLNQQPSDYHQRKIHEGQASEKKLGLEEAMMKFMSKMENAVAGLMSSVGTFSSTANTVKSATDQNTASIRTLERQVGQIAEALENTADVNQTN